ncbi:PTS sugar transporter subunit IIA [Staphylococcus lutrae]|uniref:Ascorbate-specific PTS system EIIA component n=1 Tax=Staphylococcus lutrae TaxID=155085 RepID=A0AAC9RMP0_9STAP|nr:PTS sugar transporter subunit IIA [Staphylococcus lutrae]ARJ50078.1 PTS ascorbate transporter subunit IIA [Staphylococcus lutrae]PNZ38350.1 PTS ascorbate transporter subunit IIA [Staphylococcus lutrae]
MNTFKESLISENSVLLNQHAETWEEAVKKSTAPLVKSGAVDPMYSDAIIKSTEHYGPYYLLMEGMAMPHARPEDGVRRNAFSLVTFDEPIIFSDGKSAQVFVVLAATSAEIHTTMAIPQIVAVFEIDHIIEKLTSATSIDEVLTIIDQADMRQYI